MKIDFFLKTIKEWTLQYVPTLILFIYFFNRKLKCLLQVLILDPSDELKQSDLSQHQMLPINIILNNISLIAVRVILMNSIIHYTFIRATEGRPWAQLYLSVLKSCSLTLLSPWEEKHTQFRQQSNKSYINLDGAYCRYLCTQSDRSICFIDVLALTCRQIFILRGLKTLAPLSELWQCRRTERQNCWVNVIMHS